MDYIAHKRNDTDGKEEKIIDHLIETACKAQEFADDFGFGENAYSMGRIHDIGKYGERFQKRIRGENIRTTHSTAGAIVAAKHRMLMSAFCIAGHHGGIPNGGSNYDCAADGTLKGKLSDTGIDDYSKWEDEIKDNEKIFIAEKIPHERFQTAFLTHMLFSCLVDADYLCTEKFMSNGSVKRGGYDDIETLLSRFNDHISKWDIKQTKLNALRAEIQAQCINAREINENLLSLTVPTGGGKTISSLAFALNYAVSKNHPRKRIIYVIPYTSIIEQNAEVFRNILGDENVLEHHSNVNFDNENEEEITRKQLACENWDAPIIVTTAVQFFESLFSNKPSKSRKLHNLANSVIIFDEAQMIPIDYLNPCVYAINELTERYNTTAVLCTATQPNLDEFFAKRKNLKNYKIPEICAENQERYFEEFRRVTFSYDGKISDDELAYKLSSEKQVLCVLNEIAHTKKIYGLLGESDENFCLSTRMYPNHRKKVIAEIKQRLHDGLNCRVISTSLIEAGVDIDFKTVYRAIAGIDSILQAGGRCNREGVESKENSIVHIFDTNVIPSYQQTNVDVAREVLKKYGENIYCAEAVKMYFERLYYIKNGANSNIPFDPKSIIEKYGKFDFKDVSDAFKLIEKNTMTVYIENDESCELINKLRNKRYEKNLFRLLEQYSVNVYENDYNQLNYSSAIEIIDDQFYVLVNKKFYDSKIGLIIPNENLGIGLYV